MTTIILVRHGQSMANLEGVFAGHYNAPLSPLGQKQAEKCAEYIFQNYKVDKVYSSDLDRAFFTAKAIADKFSLSVIPNKNFREIFAGDWEGLPFERLEKEYEKDFKIWRGDFGFSRCTNGESALELFKRVKEELFRIATENEGKTIVIGTHATPIRVTLCDWENLAPEQMKNITWVPNASCTVAHFENGHFSPCAIGHSDYLEDMITDLPPNV